MSKPEWGIKRQCQECGAKFYDMQASDIKCPACETMFDVEAAIRLKRNRQQLVEAQSETNLDAEAVLLDDDLDADISDDEGVLEDTSDIEDDDDVPIKIAKENDDS